ncbi:MAG: polysaccharide biosynthesis protein [bacterium]|nr:polysaccharide biosynthesis protein [Bacillota bacterium]HHW54353.1 polysaccharide biosynthesis protein [Bacillota bacterium]
MEKQSFMAGAFVLAAAGILTKIFGALYRIPLTWLIGDEGMGLYGMSYPIYTMLLALSTAGIPVAISKLVSEKITQGNYQGAHRVFRLSFFILAGTGFFFSTLLFFGARPLVARGYLADPRAYYAVVSIAPAVFLVSVMSAFRGFFQGMQTMVPTALSQLVEQLARAATALVLAHYLVGRGIEYAAAGAAFGAVVGALAGLCLLLVYYGRRRSAFLGSSLDPGEESGWELTKRIVTLAVPVSLASLVMPLVQNIDVVIVPARLGVAGYTIEEATALFGQLSQMAATLINLPTIITVSLSMSLVPAISEAYTLGNFDLIRSRVAAAVKVTIILELPAFVGLYILSDEIMTLLYGHPEAGTALAGLAAGVLFLGLHQTTSGVLQGLGRTDIPVKNLLVGAVFKVLLTYILTAQPALGIKGAALGTVTTFIIASSLNLLAIGRLVGFSLEAKEMVLKPALAVAVMALGVVQVYRLFLLALGNSLATLAAIGSGVIIYGVVLFLVGGIGARELEMIPKVGPKLAAGLRRRGLLR